MPTTVLTFSHLQLPRSSSSLSHTNSKQHDEYAGSYPQGSDDKERPGRYEQVQLEQPVAYQWLRDTIAWQKYIHARGDPCSTDKPLLQSVGNFSASSGQCSIDMPSPQGVGNISASGDATAICIIRFCNKAVGVRVPVVSTGQELLSLGMRVAAILLERAQHLYLVAGHIYLELRNRYRILDLPSILEIRERGCRGGVSNPKWDTNEQESLYNYRWNSQLLTSGLGTPLDGGTGALPSGAGSARDSTFE